MIIAPSSGRDNRPPIYFAYVEEGLLQQTILYGSICRKLLYIRQREKRWETQKSGASNLKNQAEAPLWRIQLRFTDWTSTVKTFAGFCPQKPENPHEY